MDNDVGVSSKFKCVAWCIIFRVDKAARRSASSRLSSSAAVLGAPVHHLLLDYCCGRC